MKLETDKGEQGYYKVSDIAKKYGYSRHTMMSIFQRRGLEVVRLDGMGRVNFVTVEHYRTFLKSLAHKVVNKSTIHPQSDVNK